MINNPEFPARLPEDAYKSINERIALAGVEVGASIRKLGLGTFYNRAWLTIPALLRDETRAVVNAYNELRHGTDQLHPLSLAAEKGIIVGAVLARNVLESDNDYFVLAKRLAAQFRSLRTLLPASAYDLSDTLRQAGNPVALQLKSEVDPALVTLDTRSNSPIEMRKQVIFQNAVGYVGSALITKLVELEIRAVQPADAEARQNILADLEQLDGSSFSLKPSDF